MVQKYSIPEFAGLIRRTLDTDYPDIADDKLVAKLLTQFPKYRDHFSEEELSLLDGIQPIKNQTQYKPTGEKMYEQYGSKAAPGFFKQIGHTSEIMLQQIPSAFLGSLSWMVSPFDEEAGKYLIDKSESVRKHFQDEMIQDIVKDPELQALYAWKEDEAATLGNFWHFDMFQRLLANAVPSIIGMAAMTYATRGTFAFAGAGAKATTWAGRVAGFTGAAGLEGSSLWNEAMQYLTEEEGLSNEQARDEAFGPVAVAAPLMGLMEYLPFQRVLNKSGLGQMSRAELLKNMSRRFRGNALARMGKGSLEQSLYEGSTEWMQEMTGALAAQAYTSGYGNTFEEAFDNFAQVISGNWNTPHARESFYSGTAMGLVMGSLGGVNSTSAKSLGKAYDKYKETLEADIEAGIIDNERANTLIKQFKMGVLLKGTTGLSEEDAATWVEDFESWTGENIDASGVSSVVKEGSEVNDIGLEKASDTTTTESLESQSVLDAYLSFIANPKDNSDFYDLEIAEGHGLKETILKDKNIGDVGIKLLSLIEAGRGGVVTKIANHKDSHKLAILAASGINELAGKELVNVNAPLSELLDKLYQFEEFGSIHRRDTAEGDFGEFVPEYSIKFREPEQGEPPDQGEMPPPQQQGEMDEQYDKEAAVEGKGKKGKKTKKASIGVVGSNIKGMINIARREKKATKKELSEYTKRFNKLNKDKDSEGLQELETELAELTGKKEFLRKSKQPAVKEKKVDYSKKTVKELKEELRSRKLKLSGKKADLVNRLEGDDKAKKLKVVKTKPKTKTKKVTKTKKEEASAEAEVGALVGGKKIKKKEPADKEPPTDERPPADEAPPVDKKPPAYEAPPEQGAMDESDLTPEIQAAHLAAFQSGQMGTIVKKGDPEIDEASSVLDSPTPTTDETTTTDEATTDKEVDPLDTEYKEDDSDDVVGKLQTEGVSERGLIKDNKSLAKRLERRLKKHFGKIIKSEKVEGVIEKHGKVAVGMALNRLAMWSVTHGTVDTIPHEYAHIYIDLMSDSPIVKAGIKQFKTEEQLVQAIGEYYADRMANRNLISRMKKWLSHFVRHLKVRMGIIKPEDLTDVGGYIAEEMYAGRWLGDTFNINVGSAKFQEANHIDSEGNPDGNSDGGIVQNAGIPSDLHVSEFYSNVFKIHISKDDYGRIFRPLALDLDLTFDEYLGRLIETVRKYSTTRPDRNNFNEDINDYQKSLLKLEWAKAPYSIERHLEGKNDGSDGGVVRKYLNYIVSNKRMGDRTGSNFIQVQGAVVDGVLQNTDLATGRKNPQREMSNFVEEDLKNGNHIIETLFLRVQDMLLRGKRKKDKTPWYRSMTGKIAPKRFKKIEERMLARFVKKYIEYRTFEGVKAPSFQFIVSSKAVNQGSAIYVGQGNAAHMEMSMDEAVAYWENQVEVGNMTQAQAEAIIEEVGAEMTEKDFEYYDMTVAEAAEAIQSRSDKKLTDKQMALRLKSFIKHQAELRYRMAKKIGRHEWLQAVSVENYAVEFQNLDEFMSRLTVHFSEGFNPRGTGESKLMILDDSVEVFIPDEDGQLVAAGTLGDYDGQTFSGGRWLRKIADSIGLTNLFELKTVIRSRQKNDIDGRYTNLLAAKHLQMAPFEGMVFKKDGVTLARSVGGRDQSYFVAPDGTRFDHIVPSGAAKQSTGAGSTNNFSEQNVVHTINNETDVKVLPGGLPKDSNTAAFPVNLFDMILDPNNNSSQYKELLDEIIKHYGENAKKYLDIIYNFRTNPKTLVDFLRKDMRENEHPVEIQQLIQLIGEDGKGVHHKAIAQQAVEIVNNRMIRDGIFKSRSPQRNVATNLYLKPMAALSINEGSVIVSANNKVVFNQVLKAYMKDNNISDVKEFWTSFPARKDAVKELNQYLTNNTVEILLHRQPINKIGAVKMWRVQKLENGQHGQVVFMRKEDVDKVLDGDWDGDKVLIEFIPESLASAISNYQNSKEVLALDKTNNIDMFGPRHKDSDVKKDFLSDDDIFDTISGNAKNTGSVGMVKVASSVMTVLRNKGFKLIDKDGAVIEPYDSKDEVVMDYKTLDINQLTKNNNEIAKQIYEEGGSIVKQVVDAEGNLSWEEVPINEISDYDNVQPDEVEAPMGTYEVSTKGDKRFSALVARLKDGRTIEQAWAEAKGYSSPKEAKNKPAKTKDFDYWNTYKGLWKQWAKENPDLIETLRKESEGKNLVDSFAKTENNQARALTEILKETAPEKAPTAKKGLYIKTTKMHEWNLLLQMAFDNPKYGHLNTMAIDQSFLIGQIFKSNREDGAEFTDKELALLVAIKSVENTSPSRRGEMNNRRLTLGQTSNLSEMIFGRYFKINITGEKINKHEDEFFEHYVMEVAEKNQNAANLLEKDYDIEYNLEPTPTEILLMSLHERFIKEIIQNPNMEVSRLMSYDMINYAEDFLKMAHVLTNKVVTNYRPSETLATIEAARRFLESDKRVINEDGKEMSLIDYWKASQAASSDKSNAASEQPLSADYNENMINLVELWGEQFIALPEQVQIEVTRLFLTGVSQEHMYITKILPISLMHKGLLKEYLNNFEDILMSFTGKEKLLQTGKIKEGKVGKYRALMEKARTTAKKKYESVEQTDELLKVCGI